MMFSFKFFFLSVFVVFGCLTSFSHVLAAPSKGYEALAVTTTAGGNLTFKPGEVRDVVVEFQNIGSETWTTGGAKYVSLYTYEPKYRSSVFVHSSWVSASQPVKLAAPILPKARGTIRFSLQAPKTPGTYKETFYLAAEDTTWIPGGLFTLNLQVGSQASTPVVSAPVTSNPTPSTTISSQHAALVLLRSAKTLTASGGQRLEYTVGIKNAGQTTWNKREIRPTQLTISALPEADWKTSTALASKDADHVAPGALDFFTFSFNAPRSKGEHTVTFQLVVDGEGASGGEITIPVDVTSSAPEAVKAPKEPTLERPTSGTALMAEPTVRIGVLIVDEETNWEIEATCASSWSLQDTTGAKLLERKAGKTAKAFYKNGSYWYQTSDTPIEHSKPLRFVPDEPNTVCTVTNFDRRVTRGFPYADNTFRNILELRYNPTKDRTWLINELPVELYLRGLGETSNVSHEEFQKALITIARTYALYHWERATKYKSEFFHITAYSWDQVYNGYGQEERAPRLTQSVLSTAGQVVRYQGKTAITPYFSRSDGRTRSWSEVWYGDVAWLKGVPAPCDKAKGKDLWGHGVGLSASEALCQANQGKPWRDILTYFYTGVTIERAW